MKKKPVIITKKKGQLVDWEAFSTGIIRGNSVLEYAANHNIFMQGQPADFAFYLRRGKVKLEVTSQGGKVAIVAVLREGEFFGEGCVAGYPLRSETAVALEDCALIRIGKPIMVRLLHKDPGFSELFLTYLLSRFVRNQEDLVDVLFSSSEKRLARTLLLLAHYDKDREAEIRIPRINQESLAQMVGTTRPRVSHFMNQFKRCGFIDYNRRGELVVRNGLRSVIQNA